MEFGRGRWRGGWRRRRLASTAWVSSLLCVSCFFSAYALLRDAGDAAIVSETGNSRSRGTGSPVQQGPPEATAGSAAVLDGAPQQSVAAAEGRYLVGPGSYPPRCVSKCGACIPCKPVHVPVPPGTPVIAEYYPEAWRCKCGGKLYMP